MYRKVISVHVAKVSSRGAGTVRAPTLIAHGGVTSRAHAHRRMEACSIGLSLSVAITVRAPFPHPPPPPLHVFLYLLAFAKCTGYSKQIINKEL